MFSLDGKVALVTGSERGLGKDVALTLAQQGASIAMLYYQEEEQALQTRDAIAAMGRKVVAIHADLTKQEDVNAAAAQVDQAFDRVDIIVNVVGAVVKRIPFVETDDDFWMQVFNVNLLSGVRIIRAFLPGMIRRRYGRIINISSVGSKTGGAPNSAHYAAMKGAINSLSHSLSNEVAQYGVTVNALGPGTMISPLLKDTPSWDEAAVKRLYPIGRMSTTDDVTPLIAFLASEESRYCTGETLFVSGGR